MPVLPRLIAILTLTVTVLAAGCVSSRGRPLEDADREASDADSIEIVVGSSSGIYGGPACRERWVLRRDGECKGTVTSGTNAGTGQAKTEELTLRSEEKYRECQRLLRETHFFWMRDRVPKTQFESSTTSIEVRAGIRRHSVRVVSPETPSAEFTRLTEFVDGLAKEVKGEAKK